MAGNNQPVPGQPGALGATVQSEYMVRTMKCYPVHESEMGQIGALNAGATIFFSLATGFIGYASSIWVNADFAEKLTPSAVLATKQVAPGALLVGVIFLLAGTAASVVRSGLWGRIKKDSVTLQTTIAATSLGPAP